MISYLPTKEGETYTITTPNIGKYAFSSNNYLKNITISNQQITLEDNPFAYCNSLTSISIQGENHKY